MTPGEFRTVAYGADVQANDYRLGRIVSPQGMAELWTTMAGLARECADLAQRIETQENRRVGRPPNKDRETHAAGA